MSKKSSTFAAAKVCAEQKAGTRKVKQEPVKGDK